MTVRKDARSPAAFKVRPNALESSDDSQMYALFIASVPEVDREGELLLPESFRTEEWQQNPIWLWAHDQKQLPIGAGYTTDGKVACFPSKDALRLGCKFSQANPQGALTYALYKEKTLKMVSVGFISGGAERMSKMDAARYGHDGPATLVLSPELVECSCVPIGMNRRAMIQSIKSWDGYADRAAVASILDNGHLHGEKVPDDMRAALVDLAAPRGFKAGHWPKKIPNSSFRREMQSLTLHVSGVPNMAKLASPPLAAGTVPGKPEPLKVETVTVTETVAPTVQTKAVETPVETKEMNSTDDTAGGSTVNPAMVDTLAAGMEHMLAFCKSLTDATANSDLPANLEYSKALCAKVADLIGDMGEYGAKTYPDHTDLFTESAGMADNYRVLAEENPDEADAGTSEEVEMNDEAHEEKTAEEADEGDAVHIDIGSHNEDEDEDEDKEEEKAVPEEMLTVKRFNEWYNKAFAETNAKEAVLAWVREEMGVADLGEVSAAIENLGTLIPG